MSNDPVSTQRFEDYRIAHAREHELAGEVMKEAKQVVDARLAHLNDLRQDFPAKKDLEALELRVESLEHHRTAAIAEARVWAIIAGTVVSVLLQLAFRFFA